MHTRRLEPASSIAFGNNSFDWIRLVAACSVMWGHATLHLEMPAFLHFSMFVSLFAGVIVLFSLSAYLGTAAYERSITNNDPTQGVRMYARSRFLRIYPALWMAFFVSVFTVCATYSAKSTTFDIVKWVVTQTTICQFYTPPFLRGFGVGAPNGSLWTIPITIQFYVLIPILYRRLKNASIVKWGCCLLVFVLLSVLYKESERLFSHTIWKLMGMTFIPYTYILIIGMFLYFKRGTILPLLMKYYYIILGAYLLFNVTNVKLGYFQYGTYVNVIKGIFVSLLTVATAYKLGRHRLSFDISYGIYLYHMIIVNVLVQLGIVRAYWSLALTIVLSIICGFLSWYVIEKNCLQHKYVRK